MSLARLLYPFVLAMMCHSTFAVQCPMRVLAIKNGDYSLKSGNTVVSFECNPGFTLLGSKQIVCFATTWSSDPPICIANTCPKINETAVLKIEKLYDGAMLKFSCSVMHQLEGKDKLVCDGTNWSDVTPTCKPSSPAMTCDFEDPGLCGWSHHDEDDQEWRWHTGATKTTRTGPDHDHTLGPSGAGHYMYFETSSPSRPHHEAWLSSPLYPGSYGENYCFQFWYHSLGSGSMGSMEVFIKPESSDLAGLTPKFHVNYSVGVLWQREEFPVGKQNSPYKVFFIARRSTGYRSDFAIDDVTLQRCNGQTEPATTTTTTTTTSPAPQTTTRAPAKTTVRKTTVKTSTIASSTIKPSTTTLLPSTKGSTTQNANMSKAPTDKVTHSVTPVRTTTKVKVSTDKPSSRTSTVKYNTTAGKKEVKAAQIIIKQSDSTGQKIAFMFYGVLLCLGVVLIIGLAVFFYRRRRKHVWTRDNSFVAADNPLYRVVSSDDSAVQFANVESN